MVNSCASKSTSSLRFTPLDPAALSSLRSSGRITADKRKNARLAFFSNCSLWSQLLLSAKRSIDEISCL